jgi:hypothetical protein
MRKIDRVSMLKLQWRTEPQGSGNVYVELIINAIDNQLELTYFSKI